ncbi:hypothetical protein SHLO109777_07115 [Shewanella loihica]|uniref:Uncharacterized protein n=1 Tax=Shewanella loihica (strain ATCC BAA-1088 / PV-4) TaxID=323850 RepID=A3QHH5_SHELP|nr:hypothetical protein [Shewanella loihica]ABO24923.1 hypothetical protein Shew_3057 [Shewanella loihica PV-4]
MTSRSNASKARHAESLIKIGESIHNAIILTVFVAPMIFLSKQVIEGKVGGISGLLTLILENQWPLLLLFLLMLPSTYLGVKFKHWGFDILDELESASGKKEDNHKMPELS